jgi:ubiquinone/menaquinone biosynthesis C-methylase UbiE
MTVENDTHTGAYASYYKMAFSDYDKDSTSIRAMIEQCPPGPIMEAELIMASAHDTRLTDSSVAGVIFASNTLAEMQPISFALAEAVRILKPGGLIYICIQNPEFKGICTPYFRKAKVESLDYTFYVETLAVPALGKNYFQTHFVVRSNGLDRKFIIEQCFPDVKYWDQISSTLGLEIVSTRGDRKGGEFNRDTSFFIELILRKKCSEPTGKQKALQLIYDKMAPAYDDVIAKGQYKVPDWIKQLSPPWEGHHLKHLDLACGNGIAARLLKLNGIHNASYGIDFSAQMIAECRSKGGYRGLMVADLSDGIPIPEEFAFDVVTALGLFEFISDPGKLLRQIRQVLVPGGEAWITFENSSEDTLPSGSAVPGLGIRKFHYTADALRTIYLAAGLEVLSITHDIGYISPSSTKRVPYIFVCARRSSV